jgi:hypothetical protein
MHVYQNRAKEKGNREGLDRIKRKGKGLEQKERRSKESLSIKQLLIAIPINAESYLCELGFGNCAIIICHVASNCGYSSVKTEGIFSTQFKKIVSRIRPMTRKNFKAIVLVN